MKLRRFADQPLKNKLIVYFLSLIIISVVLSGVLSYRMVVSQIKENAHHLLNDTVSQTGFFLNEKFTVILEKLVLLGDGKAIRNSILQKSRTDEDRIMDRIELTHRMNELYSTYFPMVDSIYIKLNTGQEFQLQKNEIPQSVGLNLQEWLKTYSWSEKGYYWINHHEDTIFETVKKRGVITVLRTFGRVDTPFNGIAAINLNSAYFEGILSNIQVSANGYLVLISPDGMLFSKEVAPKYDIGATAVRFLRENAGNRGSFTVTNGDRERFVVVFDSLSVNNWVLAAIVPERDLLRETDQIKYISILIIIVLVIVSSIMATLFAESFSKSIRYLSNQIRKVEAGNFSIEFNVKDNNEVGVLANGLNSLLKSVKDLMHKIREEQDKKRKLELLLLQSQIKPHFLYNTLASIQQLIENRDMPKASTMLRAITGFFRIGISRGKDMVFVSEEIEHVENYLIIQKMRYINDFEYELDIDKGMRKYTTIKLILQPIVENAIYHGIKNSFGKGCLRVKGRVDGGHLVFEIEDDGAGIPEDHLRHLLESIHQPEIDQQPITFGLKNVNQRIKLYYGPEYGIHLESKLYEYTKVTVTVPILPHEQNRS